MNRMTTIHDEQELLKFVKDAADHFAHHPEHSTFGHILPGSNLALRWGLAEDCVLVLKLHEDFQPVNFQQAIKSCTP